MWPEKPKETDTMAVQVADTIYEKVKSLPIESQEEALKFVEKLAQKSSAKRLRIFEKIDENF